LARPGDGGQARADQPTGDRLRGRELPPSLPAAVEDELLDAPLVAREQVPAKRLGEAALQRVAALLGAGVDEQVDVDLEVSGADRRDDAVAVAACICERLRDGGLARAEEAEHPSRRLCGS